MTDIVERLRAEAFDAVNWDGETMKQWDKIRKQAETLPGSDLPRLMFQGLIESLAELMVESACEIERLRNVAQPALIGRLKNKADEQTTALDQIMTTAADNLASPGSDLKMTLEFIQHVAEHTLALTSAERAGNQP